MYDDNDQKNKAGYDVKVRVRGGEEFTFLWGGREIEAAPTLPPILMTIRVDEFGEKIEFGRMLRLSTGSPLTPEPRGNLSPGESFTFPIESDKDIAVYARCISESGETNPDVDTNVWCCLHILAVVA